MHRLQAFLSLPLFAACLLTLAAPAQSYRREVNTDIGIAFRIYKKLAQVPMRIGEEGSNVVQRFEPDGEGDYIHGRYGKYSWELYVLDFGDPDEIALGGRDAGADDGPETGGEPGPKTRAEAEREARRALLDRHRAHSLEEWVTDKDPGARPNRKIVQKGKKRRASGDRPASEWWEYYDTDKKRTFDGREYEFTWYTIACAYEVDGRQIALTCALPCDDGVKPDRKYYRIVRNMLTSVETIELESGDDVIDEDRDAHADSAAKQKALERLKANISDLDNWDYFTTPRYIITFSWAKRTHKAEMYGFARSMADRLEEIREMFEEYYPPHDGMDENYSIIRVCSDYDEFLKYSNTSRGVVGWFSPSTKELCLFYDKQNLFGNEDKTIGVSYHEAWHQYADQYWPNVELHRWFDEGLAEFFASHRKKGRRFRYEYLDTRYSSIRQQIRDETYIPAREIVSWHKDKFYSGRATDHYAQGWAMVDFLIRGKERLGRRFPEDLTDVMDTYAQVCLEEGSERKALEKAFEGVDMERFDEAWTTWVESGQIKR